LQWQGRRVEAREPKPMLDSRGAAIHPYSRRPSMRKAGNRGRGVMALDACSDLAYILLP